MALILLVLVLEGLGNRNISLWWQNGNGTFWIEFVMLTSFGVAWALKGRLFILNRLLGDP